MERLVAMLFRKLAPPTAAGAAGAGAQDMDVGGNTSTSTTLGSALELMVPVLEKEFDQGRKEQILEAFSLWCVDCGLWSCAWAWMPQGS